MRDGEWRKNWIRPEEKEEARKNRLKPERESAYEYFRKYVKPQIGRAHV